ncbi:conserved hypothetical protein [Candidatus Zinderia insecticola CARI]|uniref:SAM-dependent methyltransferase n=1 Tax=Zinderia insecticola (strain CARI) TaxID=871271 RepID=E0TIL6_ZINIC|nr:conserved hypothetical protein [Candidatus Zinderia insecticola CARI]
MLFKDKYNLKFKYSKLLKYILIQKIKKKKYLKFSEFINIILYKKKIGYYNNFLFYNKKDYLTSSQISNIFTISLANFFFFFLKKEFCKILEFGGGNGKFAFNILKELKKFNLFPKYYIIEKSRYLKNIKKKKYKNIKWIKKIPKNFSGIIFLNEVLDSIPFDLIIKNNNNYYNSNIIINNELNFVFKNKKINKKYLSFFIKNRYYNLYKFINNIFLNIKNNKNIIIIIDYGNLNNFYIKNNFMCFYKHFSHGNPFSFPGLQDITNFVNFKFILKLIVKYKFKILNFSNQENFILNIGILDFLKKKKYNKIKYFNKINFLKKIILPYEMGEIFKVLILGNKINIY